MENQSKLLQFVNGNIQFTNKFYNILAEEEKNGNIFFSPLSIYIVLSMAYQGAAGETASKFACILGVSDQNHVACGCSTVMNILEQPASTTLYTVNKIYVTKNVKLKNSFKDVLAEYFLSEAESINFAEREKAADIINEWVERKTFSKIKDLIQPQYLNRETRLVLVNAIYFKGKWDHQFRKKDTARKSFYVSNEEEIECEVMQTTKYFNYCEHEELDAKIIEMKYSNENVSMIVILPNARDGIRDLENKLNKIDLKTITQYMRSVEVNVHLPKFKMETTVDLGPVLEKMGLGIMFTPQADFSKMTENVDCMYVNRAVQKLYIDVDEEGCEVGACMPAFLCDIWDTDRTVFNANHPFIILLRIKYQDLTYIVFYGKVLKPNAKKE